MNNETINLGLTTNIYLTDILDVFIIAILSYIAILFLRQTRSLTAFLGIGVIGIIYTLARAFHLYITTLILQSFFSIFIIVLVIVFQDELKRSFELIITSSTRKIKSKSTDFFSSTVFSVTQAASNLMRKKHGALIVIPGGELIDRHLKGGNILDGIVTATVLESIFNPKSPGHDGAIIISKNRITRFGVHLPLSHNIKQIKEKGTRHSAGLGISEKTDALVVIISEERGEISIAKNGKIKTINSTQELEKHIQNHFEEHFPEKTHSPFKSIFKERLLEKFSAIGIACFAWFFFVFQAEVVQRDFSVPISYTNISEELIIKNTLPETVTITLSARGQAVLSSLSPESLRVSISGNEIESGENEIEIERTNIARPFNVSVVNISPATIIVTAQKYNKHEISVEPNITERADNFIITETSVNPSKISVLVPEEEEPVEYLQTEEINAEFIFATTALEKRIILPESYKLHQDESRRVYVTLVVEQKNNALNENDTN